MNTDSFQLKTFERNISLHGTGMYIQSPTEPTK